MRTWRHGWRHRLRREVRGEGLGALIVLLAALTLIAVGLAALPLWPLALTGPVFAFGLFELGLGLRQVRYWRRLRVFENNA